MRRVQNHGEFIAGGLLMDKISIARFKSQGKPVPNWWRVAYLIPDIFRRHTDLEDGFTKVVAGRDAAFTRFVQDQVKAYIEEDKMPAESIAGAIINIAEDVVAGRDVIMRAGDYIALQNFRRAK
jgi:hypothetical protein